MSSPKRILRVQGDKQNPSILELVLDYATTHHVNPKHQATIMQRENNTYPLLRLADVLKTWEKLLDDHARPKFAKYSDSADFNKIMAHWYAGWRTLKFWYSLDDMNNFPITIAPDGVKQVQRIVGIQGTQQDRDMQRLEAVNKAAVIAFRASHATKAQEQTTNVKDAKALRSLRVITSILLSDQFDIKFKLTVPEKNTTEAQVSVDKNARDRLIELMSLAMADLTIKSMFVGQAKVMKEARTVDGKAPDPKVVGSVLVDDDGALSCQITVSEKLDIESQAIAIKDAQDRLTSLMALAAKTETTKSKPAEKKKLDPVQLTKVVNSVFSNYAGVFDSQIGAREKEGASKVEDDTKPKPVLGRDFDAMDEDVYDMLGDLSLEPGKYTIGANDDVEEEGDWEFT